MSAHGLPTFWDISKVYRGARAQNPGVWPSVVNGSMLCHVKGKSNLLKTKHASSVRWV